MSIRKSDKISRSMENKMVIKRPTLFAECANCELAAGQIQILSVIGIPKPYVSAAIKEINVNCDVVNDVVTMKPKIIYNIQYVRKHPVLEVEGECTTEWNVNCPHFKK